RKGTGERGRERPGTTDAAAANRLCPDSGEVDLKAVHAEAGGGQTTGNQEEPRGPSGMAAKKSRSGLPQSTPRAELKVHRGGNSEGRLPVPTNLRKQKSLTNLCVLTDSEKKMHLYQPKWSDDMAKPAPVYIKSGKPKEGGSSGRVGNGPLSRNLSKSEHSLLQCKAKPFSPLAAPANLAKPSRIPRGPYAEVKPISKMQESVEDTKSDDEILSSKAKVNGKKSATSPSGATTAKSKGHEEEDAEKPFLKVDPELVVTVLGDLEQLLFSQVLDPESQRKRTVQNVLDLRQNLEDTMSSLRGSQLSHSCLESSVCYDSDETNARSMSSYSNRSSPLSWRQGQASPRLQAGDAPSSTGSPASHARSLRGTGPFGQIHRIELVEDLDALGLGDLKSDYLSNKDEDDDVDVEDDDLANGWDESSSISSGLSDGSDNLSSEEFNAGSSLNSVSTTPVGSRRNSAIVLRTDAEKRSLVESGLSWYSEEGKTHRRSESSYDTGSLKTDPSSKWKKTRPMEDTGVKGELKKPQSLGHHPSGLKKSRNTPVGVTSPITNSSQSLLKPPGEALDKTKMAVKNSGLQRSSSDAGKDRGEHRKPPSGLLRPSAGNSFGYKKPTPMTSTATVLTPGGSAVSSGSSTVGKAPKSSGIPVKPVTVGGRKTSLDVSNCDQGFLSPNARNNIQYRSLPRPAKSSALSLMGGRPGARPVSTNMDGGSLTLKTIPAPSRLKEPSSGKGIVRPSSANPGGCGPVNQTDREKEKARARAVVSDSECGSGSVKAGSAVASQPNGESSSKLLSLRHPSSLGNVDSGVGSVQDLLPPKVPAYSKLQDMAGLGSTVPCLTPSPAPELNVNSSECFTSPTVNQNSSRSPLLYPRLSGLHRSMESLPLQLSVSPAAASSVEPGLKTEDKGSAGAWNTGARTCLILTDSQYSSLEDDSKERRHSHTILSLPESESPPPLPSPLSLPCPSSGKIPLTNMVSPSPVGGTPRMTRSNSIPTHEASFELYTTSAMGSTLSLSDRPKSMIRSGSFRDRDLGDDVHGSVLSLASSVSSSYSSVRLQIRKLKRELENSQDKVANLTSQLSANANLVAAFEQSLALMTTRLQMLSVTAEQKDTELFDLRETIETLKTKNSEAQAVIQGALSNPDPAPKELRIRRQNSSESICSLNSITSHSSVGSLKEHEKKKKKKSWLRNSFNKAFSIKKGSKPGSLYSDIEEIVTPDSSAPSSPKMPHEGGDIPESLQSSQSATSSVKPLLVICAVNCLVSLFIRIIEESETDEKAVSELRSELWEKEMKLTDIRLEALSSAHQLEQLREAMNSMQVYSRCFNSEIKYYKIFTVKQDYYIGSVRIHPKTDWQMLDKSIMLTFKEYISKVDPTGSMGLSTESVHSYEIHHTKRVLGTESADTPPLQCSGPGCIKVSLKGLKEMCVDSLVFETLVPKTMVQHYISLLLKHRRLILSGPSGTGKTYLTSRLGQYLVERSGLEAVEGTVVTFNMHNQSCKDLQCYLSNLANQIDHESNSADIPLVIVIDDLSDPSSLSELINSALTCKYHKCPYIIGTTNQPMKMISNHGLHLSFRMITFSNNVEPANGFLVRYLHRKLIEAENESIRASEELLRVLDWVPKLWYHLHTFLEKHSTSDFLIGPCFFLSCPVTVEEFRPWFIDLWNQSIIPYLQEGAKDGMKAHGHRAAWEDPVEWVRDTLPWPSAQQDQVKLFHLPPPSMSPNSTGPTSEEKSARETPLANSVESDPLMAMLLKLQESANYVESPEREISGETDFHSTV
uniref:Neuron navigator 1 n=1 Tax=Denticeps clupeoides TaxID=299321 RepID=A0AAY4CB68_9TELE